MQKARSRLIRGCMLHLNSSSRTQTPLSEETSTILKEPVAGSHRHGTSAARCLSRRAEIDELGSAEDSVTPAFKFSEHYIESKPMKVSEILTPDPQCVSPDTTLTTAAQKMKSLDVGLLPICQEDRLVGTVTDRDIVVRAIATGVNPNTTTIRDVMSPEVVYCFEDEEVEEAAQLMEQRQIRRLPVLNGEKRLVGILSLGDIAVRNQQDKLAGEVLERISEPGTRAN
jgi:CBS domain-containing protein